MAILQRVLFAIGAVGTAWLLMQAVHEFGHVVGAWSTGARVERVVIHPLSIARTDVSGNQSPLVVTWCGPILGSLLPLAGWAALRGMPSPSPGLAQFFAGFCLITNGLYLAVGAWSGVGDCGELLRHGAPAWSLVAVGAFATAAGLTLWHRLGSPYDALTAGRQLGWPVVAVSLGAFVLVAGVASVVSG
ncbi:MAG: hypothetical protein KF847_04780 [Pirellulales bacterium]|nr:hypothetical protein [Pirellulales bacterium]